MPQPYIGQMVILNDEGDEQPAVVAGVHLGGRVDLHVLPAYSAAFTVRSVAPKELRMPGGGLLARFWTPVVPHE